MIPVNASSGYAFTEPIDVEGIPLRGVREKQGMRFGRAGWLAVRDGMPTDVYGPEDYDRMHRATLRPQSGPMLRRAREEYATRTVPPFPRYHILEPTSICNRACPFCPISALNPSRAAKGRIDWTDALAYFLDCGQHEVYGLSLYQLGEPLLWKGHDGHGMPLDLRDLVRVAKDIGGFQVVNVSTNGDVPNLDLLFDCPVDDVIISIDGTTAATYGENRPSTARADLWAFRRTIQRVRDFLHQKAIRTAGRQGLPYVRLQIINKANTAPEIPAFIREWLPRAGVDDVFVKDLDGMVPWVGDGAVSAAESATKLAQVGTMPCQHLWTIGSMTAEGTLNACCHDARTELTDGSHVLNVTPATFWRGPYMTGLRERHLRGDYPMPCATCPERDVWLG